LLLWQKDLGGLDYNKLPPCDNLNGTRIAYVYEPTLTLSEQIQAYRQVSNESIKKIKSRLDNMWGKLTTIDGQTSIDNKKSAMRKRYCPNLTN
jgi:hypothetical protein